MGEVKPGVVIGGSLLGLMGIAGVQYYTITKLGAVETRLVQVQEEQAKTKEALDAEVQEQLTKVQRAASQASADREQALANLRDDVEQARRQAISASGSQLGQEALKGVKELNTRLATSEQQLKESQNRIASEVTGLKQATTENHTTIAAVNTEVLHVKDQVDATRGQLESTIAELKRVNGDLGVMSGLIATNGKEIDALRQLGDRNYAEFTIRKGKDAVRVGDIWVLLKATNDGRNRYTIELRTDDRKIEKKDRSLNEPVQFYVGHNRQPHELVVNQIQKNAIVGYMATPKVASTR